MGTNCFSFNGNTGWENWTCLNYGVPWTSLQIDKAQLSPATPYTCSYSLY
jgi:hypothetical protein